MAPYRNGTFKRSLSELSSPEPEPTPSQKRTKVSLTTPTKPRPVPRASSSSSLSPSPKKTPTKDKKLAILETYRQTPFPDFIRPTPEECQNIHDLLSTVHGTPTRPTKLVDDPNGPAGCGEVPNVLDALIRTILSASTTSANSTRAKQAMDAKYGRANYRAVLEGSQQELAKCIMVGGLGNIKAKSIMGVLTAIDEKEEGNGELSLNYLHTMDDISAMRELVSFPGVGPKTASCVLLMCLGRESFAVDTHVFRTTLALGWLPTNANRETAFQHLDVRIPDHLKYGLHSLFVKHGRGCEKCSANGVTTMDFVDTCPLDGIIKRSRKVSPKKGTGGAKRKAKGKAVVKEEEEEEEGEEEEGLKVGADETLDVPSEPTTSSTRVAASQTVKKELNPTEVGKELKREVNFYVAVPPLSPQYRTLRTRVIREPKVKEAVKETMHGMDV
ncbi:hypothetical protein MNV49_001657 [Pseudohyphozyma bogoriensis]|nr:hypothetical protein MNV49_001657 [Pseudohyphozyma bogoriensis]